MISLCILFKLHLVLCAAQIETLFQNLCHSNGKVFSDVQSVHFVLTSPC